MSVSHPIFSLSAGLPRLGWFIAVACGLLAQPFAAQADTLADLVDGKPEPHLVAEGFTFTEGPATDAKGDIYFSDIPTGKIHRWKVPAGGVPPAGTPLPEQTVETWLDPSGNTNGLSWGQDGKLYGCQMGTLHRMVVIDPTTKEITPLVERFEGKRLNNPNELFIDASGAIWFSDPAYDRKPEELEVPSEAVYWISPDRQTVKRVAEGFKRPNGVLGTPDGKFLYISDRIANETWIYPILGPGELGERKKFCDIGCDGLAIDEHGNLYATPKKPMIVVLAPDGSTVGEIPLPGNATNLTFGGPDRKTLFITSGKRVLALPMKVTGGG